MHRHIIIGVLAILFLLPASLTFAEEKNPHGQGYIFWGPGAIVEHGSGLDLFHIGGGGEGIFYKGLGAGADLSYVAPGREPSAGIGLLTLNGMYHFRHNDRLSPFITAGYSLAFRAGHINMFNFGGGTHWWFSNTVGLRLEFRDHLYRQDNLQYLEGRIGLSFR